eukprot:CAMPEP_0179323544 /NCGR_PEP_ID=MMETSP0797-20121207/59778_1 /TAXON_ID=47934 /ORGANISM="Dinophysis acuminata, Strain DAEP01" /LENGTH=57 /DNA_ID=CAMNT_0021035395 /DNA_START=58 /DNA_END=227 /DNA_ORIENTATION=-
MGRTARAEATGRTGGASTGSNGAASRSTGGAPAPNSFLAAGTRGVGYVQALRAARSR